MLQEHTFIVLLRMFDIVTSEIVRQVYKGNNYVVINNPAATNKDLCVLFFSSNGIYFPDTEESFTATIIEKDRFEWFGIRPDAGRYVYVRDVFKQWYISGINQHFNDPDKLLILLKDLIGGYNRIYTVGSSAGGYAAILYGSLLGADRVFAFNPQVEIYSEEQRGCFSLLTHSKKKYAHYYDLTKMIEALGDRMYYFLSVLSERDIKQYQHVNRLNIKVIKIINDVHGVPVRHDFLPYLIDHCKDKLDKLPLSRDFRFGFVEYYMSLEGLRFSCVWLEDSIRSFILRIIRHRKSPLANNE